MKRVDREMLRDAERVWKHAEELRAETIEQIAVGPRGKAQQGRCDAAVDKLAERRER